jgi:hypothetical protein
MFSPRFWTRTVCSLKELACWLASLELYARSKSSHVLAAAAILDSNPRIGSLRAGTRTFLVLAAFGSHVLASLEPFWFSPAAILGSNCMLAQRARMFSLRSNQRALRAAASDTTLAGSTSGSPISRYPRSERKAI